MYRAITLLLPITLLLCSAVVAQPITYPIVDTGQDLFYSDTREISTPDSASPWFGQDAQY